MRVLVIEPPAPIVTYEDAVARLRLAGGEGERADVEAMIAAATGHIDGPDGWLGRAIGVQTLEARFDGFVSVMGSMFLPCRPVIEVLSVKYVDPDGVVQTLDADGYDDLGHEIIPPWQQSWPTCRGGREDVRVQYKAGYEVVPEPIKTAVLLMVGAVYQDRENAPDIPPAAAQFLSPYRVFA